METANEGNQNIQTSPMKKVIGVILFLIVLGFLITYFTYSKFRTWVKNIFHKSTTAPTPPPPPPKSFSQATLLTPSAITNGQTVCIQNGSSFLAMVDGSVILQPATLQDAISSPTFQFVISNLVYSDTIKDSLPGYSCTLTNAAGPFGTINYNDNAVFSPSTTDNVCTISGSGTGTVCTLLNNKITFGDGDVCTFTDACTFKNGVFLDSAGNTCTGSTCILGNGNTCALYNGDTCTTTLLFPTATSWYVGSYPYVWNVGTSAAPNVTSTINIYAGNLVEAGGANSDALFSMYYLS